MKQEKRAVKVSFREQEREYTYLKYDCKNEKVSRNSDDRVKELSQKVR